MDFFDGHLLDAMLLLPVVGALLCATFPAGGHSGVRALALTVSLVGLALAALAGARFEPGAPGWQLAVEAAWLPSFGVSFRLGVDGLSLALVLLASALLPPVVLATFGHALPRPRDAMICLLLLHAAMLGALMATDLFLFYVSFEAMLLPAMLLVVMWGGQGARRAAVGFVVTTLVGSLLMLVGLLASVHAASHLGPMSFAQEVVQARLAELTLGPASRLLFFTLVMGFGIKAAMFPLHGWLAGLYEAAPPWATALIAGVMGKIGVFALVRYAFGLYPQVARLATPALASLALVGVIYAAWLSIGERHLHRRLAYASMSHMGLMILGVVSMSPTALVGASFEMVAHGISAAALFLLASMLADRGLSPHLGEVRGLAARAPAMATLFVAASMAFIGLPGMGGFVGEMLVLIGTFAAHSPPITASVGEVAGLGVWLLRGLMAVGVGGVAVALWRGRAPLSALDRALGLSAAVGLALWLAAPPIGGRVGAAVRPLVPYLDDPQAFGELLPLLAAAAVLATVLSAVAMLSAIGRLFFGGLSLPEGHHVSDLDVRERLVVAPLIAATLALGLAPQVLLDRLAPTARLVAGHFAGAVGP